MYMMHMMYLVVLVVVGADAGFCLMYMMYHTVGFYTANTAPGIDYTVVGPI